MGAEEALEGPCVQPVGGRVVDDVQGELCDVADGGIGGDDDFVQVEQREVDLRGVVRGDLAC